MNEKIKQLAEQAQQYAECTTPQGLEWFDAFKEKFANLIVAECIKIVENEAAQYSEPVWALELVNDIAEQFGAEQ
jgi:hypothetical protein